ncbi:IclR family transcriptional regulator [Conexibacter sp. CPCC 206217]|uniref:IclR family transcriptional regulator n=1 Tax=Conexibacter sp. CPCC 206217 TaxID=3064574 RepID=UPI002717EA74|nr:IclR family transcriptional regulator [Conexibacter sp. CPCC 206217]MDO8212142.1 IclR family transcriptional regulator [Conexibacter sp. CPCC 206217]
MTAPTAPPEATDGASSARGVQSVRRAIALMASLVDNHDGLTLTELARNAELSVSTAHRLIQTLCDGDILCRDADDERFVPGPLLMRLARSSLAHGGLGEASDAITDLSLRTGETATFVVRDGRSALVMIASPPLSALRIERQVGERLGLLDSAAGHALLAYSPEPVRESVALFGEPTTALVNEIRAVSYRRWAYDDDHATGIRALAAPILGVDHTATTVVSLEGPASRVTDDRIETLAADVQRCARSLRHLPISMASMASALDAGPAMAPRR